MGRKIRNSLFSVMLLAATLNLSAQIFNDECNSAFFLGSIQQYCSEISEFSNIGATDSPDVLPFCWFNDGSNDVWFSFTPTAPAVYIQLFGSVDLSNPNETNFQDPKIAFYDGPCSALTELGCNSVDVGPNIAELTINDLIIGKVYYLRVSSADGEEANFHMCIESFVPVPSPESDCVESVVLCDKSGFLVENINSVGNDPNELLNSGCEAGNAILTESASVWYTWTCEQSGSLTFVLDPNNPNSEDEDLDFIVFELPNGLTDCDNKVALRCMFSGETGGATPAQNAPCLGATGLAIGSTDVSESPGCQTGDDNFLAPLDMVAGTSYALVVNNFSQSGFGFSIDFGGTGTFLGPQPNFEVTAVGNVVECEKEVFYENFSVSATDPIIDYQWSFGAGATPQISSGIGPHLVEYESFGLKTAALTVTSDRGCTVTELIDIFVEPCCKDTTTLAADGFGIDLPCFQVAEGSITAQGLGGAPQYMYSIDGVNFQPNPNFSNLAAGDYELIVQDIKGCEEMVVIMLNEPDPILVNVGEDIILDLGFTADINSIVENAGSNYTLQWSPEEGLSCTDCLNPTIQGGGVPVYTLTITDENGCTASDQLRVSVDIKRPIYPPTIFSPNGDGVNDYFNIFVGPAVSSFDELEIYDRWGNLIYKDSNIPLNSTTDGWDGLFKGDELDPAVFTWVAKISFVDMPLEPLTYSGDISLIR